MTMTVPRKHKLLVLEESMISAILRDARFLEMVPCLAAPARKFTQTATQCGSCTSTRNTNRREVLQEARACLISMGDKQRHRFKHLLRAEKVRLIYYNDRGKRTELTF